MQKKGFVFKASNFPKKCDFCFQREHIWMQLHMHAYTSTHVYAYTSMCVHMHACAHTYTQSTPVKLDIPETR